MINLELPDLPYSKDALAPYMSAETLELHHDKHHMAYVTNGNKFIKENNFNEDSYLQALFQWQPDSATIFYFGGTINREDIEGTWENESSQIYMKFQYLFNFD